MRILKTLPLMFGLSLIGCSKAAFEIDSKSSGMNLSSSYESLGNLACLASTPQFSLDTSIDSFALTSGASASAGFGIGSILQAIGLDITYSTGELDMSMNLYSPLYKSAPIGTATGGSSSQNFSFSASAVANLISGSIGAWHTTGLYDLSNSTLSTTFTNVLASAPAITWATVVAQDLGNQEYMIPVGSTAGVLVGDTFNVYKVDYIWENGVPCGGILQMVKKNTLVGTATVTQTDYYASSVSIVNPTASIAVGDRLEIKALKNSAAGAARTKLRYSINLKSVTQAKGLYFQTGVNGSTTSVDMTPYVRSQIQDLLVNQLGNYYIQ